MPTGIRRPPGGARAANRKVHSAAVAARCRGSPDLDEANRLPSSRIVGEISVVVRELEELVARTNANEVMVTSVAFDLSAADSQHRASGRALAHHDGATSVTAVEMALAHSSY